MKEKEKITREKIMKMNEKRRNRLIYVEADLTSTSPCEDCDLYYICGKDFWVSQMCIEVRHALNIDIFWKIY